ncbi:MAG: thioredoxin family protein [Fidelibacterota bacterium]|nr:MAG: thioredoxin family protein [Candidatus Neomarinimicrobiota bacterium]
MHIYHRIFPVVFILLIALLQVCAQDSTGSPVELPRLFGIQDRTVLTREPYSVWYLEEYQGYDVNSDVLNSLKSSIASLKIDIFMGAWCSDSRREVPRFYKILDSLKISNSDVKLVMLNREKASPTREEADMNIHHVPTFIIYLDQVEIGRIIETPINTLEEDLESILTGEVYVPNYIELE